MISNILVKPLISLLILMLMHMANGFRQSLLLHKLGFLPSSYLLRAVPNGRAKTGHHTVTCRHLFASILIVGKKNGAEQWINDGYLEYEKRLKPVLKVETTFVKDNAALVKACEAARGRIIALDENGENHTSTTFTSFLYESFEAGGANVCFVIGGYSGLPLEIKEQYPLISLSKMTWTHQMARLLLIEQIYRASEIRKGSSYHKA